MAKIHQHLFKTDRYIKHKWAVSVALSGHSKSHVFELLVNRAYAEVKQQCPAKVKEIEERLRPNV